MVLRAMVTAAETVTRFLRRLGEDPEPPPLAPPRKPPFFVSPALRQRLGGLDTAVADASGNGHTATASASAAKLVPGKVEMATQIDVGGYLTVQGPDTLKYAGKSAAF